jgi:putative addiction module component (TIGR02574 family)
MPDLVTELASQFCSFPAEDRSRLVDFLLESLHEPPIAELRGAWVQDIDRRLAAIGRGDVDTFPAEQVTAEARRIASLNEPFSHGGAW